MSVSSTTDTSSAIANYTSSATGSNSLNEADFLELLVAQLEHQDPLDPQSNTEFVAQMAQFSSLEQQTVTNEKLDAVISSGADVERAAAFDLLDQQVVVKADSFHLKGDEVDLGISLADDASEVSVEITDAEDNVVATLEFSDLDAGDTYFNWDGCDAAGNPLPEGQYNLAVTAKNGETEVTGSQPLVKTRVDEVVPSQSGSILGTDAGDVLMSSVYSVLSDGESR